MQTVVLVTGSGRSGTSMVAGTLKLMGHHVPQPEVPADARNPRGYHEPAWVADFHKRWLDGLGVRTIDARPHAAELAWAGATPDRGQRLRDWLTTELAGREDDAVLVVKDPRALWVLPLWQETTTLAGARLAVLTMLRHPTQVARSRDAAYLTALPDEARRRRAATNVAAWVNALLVTERATRGGPRAVVPYRALVDDWRTALARACEQLDVPTGDLRAPHPVDDFITPDLDGATAGWEGLAVPAAVADLAERGWRAAHDLVEAPQDRASQTALDDIGAEYATLYDVALALAGDDVPAETRARLDRKNARIERLRHEVADLRERLGTGSPR